MIEFEIDYPHEHAGWIDCFLTFDGNRHKLWASDVFPPFMPLVYFLKAILIQRLPHKFYWDEEGKGAKFEVWPVAPDSPVFRLRVKHDRDERPWIEEEFNRVAVVQMFLPVLREFAAHQQPTRGDWQIRPEDVDDLEAFLTRSIPPRTEISVAQPLHFSFSRSEHFELPAQWLTWTTWDMPMLTWMLTDTDPFWQDWFAILEKIATGQPAEFIWENRASNEFTRELVESGELPFEELEPAWHMKVRAEPLPHPNRFRLTITDTDSWYSDFPLLDEILDRRQMVQAFCETFEQFLEKDYQVFAEEDGRVFDLRTLPLDRIKTLLQEKENRK